MGVAIAPKDSVVLLDGLRQRKEGKATAVPETPDEWEENRESPQLIAEKEDAAVGKRRRRQETVPSAASAARRCRFGVRRAPTA
jgi:hypothetical protein